MQPLFYTVSHASHLESKLGQLFRIMTISSQPQLFAEWIGWIGLNGLAALITAATLLLTRLFDTRFFGWKIPSRAAAIGLGLGFLMRTAMYVQQLGAAWQADYAAMRWLHYGNIVFAGVLLLSTCVWGETFLWTRLTAMLWLFLYIEEPVWTLTLHPQSEQLFQTQLLPTLSPVNPYLGGVLLFEAVLMLLIGSIWFVNRPGMISPRPDTMSARVLAGWPLAYAVWAPTLAFMPFDHARGGIVVNMIWLAAWVIAMLVWRKHFNLAHRSNKVWLGICALLLVLLGLGYAMQG